MQTFFNVVQQQSPQCIYIRHFCQNHTHQPRVGVRALDLLHANVSMSVFAGSEFVRTPIFPRVFRRRPRKYGSHFHDGALDYKQHSFAKMVVNPEQLLPGELVHFPQLAKVQNRGFDRNYANIGAHMRELARCDRVVKRIYWLIDRRGTTRLQAVDAKHTLNKLLAPSSRAALRITRFDQCQQPRLRQCQINLDRKPFSLGIFAFVNIARHGKRCLFLAATFLSSLCA